MYLVRKIDRRLWIIDESGRKIYTPPNFVMVSTREQMQRLADELNAVGRYDIGVIASFEDRNTIRRKI